MLPSTRATEHAPVQGFPAGTFAPSQRGTQDSNLESPVLETGNSWDSHILSSSHSPLPPPRGAGCDLLAAQYVG